MVSCLSRTFRWPNRENPTFTAIQLRYQAEEAQRRAEQAAKEARDLAERAKWEAVKKNNRVPVHYAEVDKAVARTAEGTEQMRNAEKIMERAHELSNEVKKAARGEVKRLVRKARKERVRAWKIHKDAAKAIAVAAKEKEKALVIVEKRRHEANAGKALAEWASRSSVVEMQKAIVAMEEAGKRLKEGIQPLVTPSPEEVISAKWRVNYQEDFFHFAVVGVPGRGKSSLVNAFSGLSRRAASAVAAGTKKATLQMTGYPDANPEKPFVWYDVPSTDTLPCHSWQYFNKRGLYVFDCIIILFNDRFMMSDIATLVNARRFNIPTYIVCANADQQIQKIMVKTPGYSRKGYGEDVKLRNKLCEAAARNQFMEKTRSSVRTNLRLANLPDQRVYIVSKTTLLNVVQSRMPKKIIDEADLLNDLLSEVYSRRYTPSDGIPKFAKVHSRSRR